MCCRPCWLTRMDQQCPRSLHPAPKPPSGVGGTVPATEALARARISAFLEGLRVAGFQEWDIELIARATGGDPNRVAPMAAELVSGCPCPGESGRRSCDTSADFDNSDRCERPRDGPGWQFWSKVLRVPAATLRACSSIFQNSARNGSN